MGPEEQLSRSPTAIRAICRDVWKWSRACQAVLSAAVGAIY